MSNNPINVSQLPRGVTVIPLRNNDGRFYTSIRRSGSGVGRRQFPGGHVEVGEDPADAAFRELREETGLLINKDRLLFLGSEIAVGYSGSLYHGFRYGLLLASGETLDNPEPEKHSDWEPTPAHAVWEFRESFVANTAIFAMAFNDLIR